MSTSLRVTAGSPSSTTGRGGGGGGSGGRAGGRVDAPDRVPHPLALEPESELERSCRYGLVVGGPVRTRRAVDVGRPHVLQPPMMLTGPHVFGSFEHQVLG